ncbi:hypothetical protein LPB140_10150 [Sphingorhabdus lutea]|uniref:M23ase beta-sheet core domain-containing protein n=2 Tax=Sphingorhabdus lutea TaxID=1913578 RepID=A0A1L3JF76_9SPHN|nr:hypothetical protein LPB140_10150 [Sphingorhabdus lutea]
MRSNGQIKFLKFSAKLQKRIFFSVSALIIAWLLITLFMAANQYSVSLERMALTQKEAKVQSAEERVSDYKDSIDDVAKDISKRQDMLDALSRQYMQDMPEAEKSAAPANANQNELSKKVGAIIPEAAALAEIEQRQINYAIRLTKLAQLRAARAEKEIKKFGLNPQAFMDDNKAQGGPFIAFFGQKETAIKDPRFAKLEIALARMSAMEDLLSSIPSSMPAVAAEMSSGFGFRSDPFNGRGAMHSGLDFRGAHGTPILAAADGVVSFAGGQSGYGNTVEITHANGLMTRYAHLSAINVKVGQKLLTGTQVGKMGSTGRSTGTHLHFEVRVNGQAINPRKFLEAGNNVLKVKGSNSAGNSASKGTK